MPVVGSEDFRYERVPIWPKLPKYWNLGTPSDGAVNSIGEVHILSRESDHPLTIWDSDGNFVSSWGEGSFSSVPHGIFIAPNNNVWIVDRDFHIATEYSPDGRPLNTLGVKLSPSPTWEGKFVRSRPFNMPANLAIAPSGDLFVADGYGAHRVHRFSPEGELLLSWGMQGTGPGQFALVHNIWVDKNGRVFVADCENDRLQIFDEEGNFLEQWADNMANPSGLCIDGDFVYVGHLSPEGELGPGIGSGAVSIWTLDGERVTGWKATEGVGKDSVVGPHDLFVDEGGNIYVCEARGKRVSKFQKL